MSHDTWVRFRSHVARIFHDHGPLLLVVSWLLYALTFLRFTNLWLWLPKKVLILRSALNQDWQKSMQWWQDIGLGAMLLSTIPAISLAWSPSPSTAVVATIFAGLVLYEMLGYQVRVIWLDDIGFSSPPKTTRVWSHRRSLFVGLLAYIQSILLFPVLYHSLAAYSACSYGFILSASFGAATAFSVPASSGPIGPTQVAVSLFYLALIISTMASSAYRRGDIAADP